LGTGMAATLLEGQPIEHVEVVLSKSEPTTRVGIALWHDLPERAIVHTVQPNSPAAAPADDGSGPKLVPFDEILTVNGEMCESALHAVTMIRNAESAVVIRKLPCPLRLTHAANLMQGSWRAIMEQRLGLERRALHKAALNTLLGISFSPELQYSSVVKTVNASGPAAGVLVEGDRVISINGERCDEPSGAAALLRAADGMIELTVQPAARVDIRALRMREGTYDDGEDSQEGEEGEEEEEGDEEEEEDEEGEESEEGFSSHDGGRDATSGGIPGVSRPKPVEPPKPQHACLPGIRRAPAELVASSPSPVGRLSQVDIQTSSTRNAVAGQAVATRRLYEAGGWKEWLRMKKAMSTVVTRPELAPGTAPPKTSVDQRV